MKILLYILLIWTLPLFAQNQVAVIDDPDGFTNIRQGKGTNYPIIGKINKGERFRFNENDSNWWTVETAAGINGYVYKDRIKPLSKIECSCYKNTFIGTNSDMEPSMVANLDDNNKVSICGGLEPGQPDKTLEISEFVVFDCATGEMLVEYGAMQFCKIKNEKNKLIITELAYLPVGEDWKFEDVPYAEQIIESQNLHILTSKVKPVLQIPELPDEKIEEFLKSIRIQKGKGSLPDWEEDIPKLLIIALSGNQEATNILLDLETYIDFETDGAQAETYRDAVATYRWIKK